VSPELLEEIVALSAQGLLVIDASQPELPITLANPAYAQKAGCARSELVGSSWLAQVALDDDAPEVVRLRQSLSCEERVDLSLPLLTQDGDVWIGRLALARLATGSTEQRLWLLQVGQPDRAGAESAELLKRALSRARNRLSSLDRTDTVTGLLSRAQFEMLMRRELSVARRESQTIELLLFAVPELEVYRRTFGDNAAESCLRMIGAQIAGTFRRASDLSARWSPSVLAVAIHSEHADQARQLADIVEQKVRNLALRNPRGRLGRTVFVQSVWVLADPAGEDFDQLIERATQALETRSAPDPQLRAASV